MVRLAAAAMLLVAGFVDAIAFLYLGGNFVSFMSGNTTRFGASVSDREGWHNAAMCAALISLFFCGIVLGSLLNRWHWLTRHTGSSRESVLWAVTIGMTVGATIAQCGAHTPGLMFIAVVTGAINATFERDSRVSGGLTYVTGTLVTAGRQLADVLTGHRYSSGGSSWAWVITLGMWANLAIGAVLGGLAYRHLGTSALWFAVGVLLPLTVSVAVYDRRR